MGLPPGHLSEGRRPAPRTGHYLDTARCWGGGCSDRGSCSASAGSIRSIKSRFKPLKRVEKNEIIRNLFPWNSPRWGTPGGLAEPNARLHTDPKK